MKADILDKILVIILILLLPLGVFLIAKNPDLGGSSTKEDPFEQAKMEKINQTLNQLTALAAMDKKDKTTPIQIDSVAFASSSGELTIKGVAPGRSLNVMVAATVMPAKTSTTKSSGEDTHKTASSSADTSVLGQSVEVVAIKTDEVGKFTLIKKIDKEKLGVIELRFEQGESSATLQYDLVANKRAL